MAKQSGLGDNFYIGGYNISGDVNSLGNISSPRAVRETTGIDKLAMERDQLHKDGQIEFTSFFNDAAGQEHAALSTLPTADTIASYFRGTTVGNAAASMTAKQLNYDGARTADGGFTFTVQAQANAYGLEWGQMLTAGVRTDAGAVGSGTSIDTGGSLSFGWQLYIQVFAFSGTSAEIRVQDSADNSAWATLASATNTFTTAPNFIRLASSNTATVRRYLRVITQTATSFTSISYAVMIVKNEIAGTVF